MDSHEIKRVANKYKSENGNAKVTSNELGWYTLHKLDNHINNTVTKDTCESHRKQMSTSKGHSIAISAVLISAMSLIIAVAVAVAASKGG